MDVIMDATIDKPIFYKKLSDDKVINLIGESGSGKSSISINYKNDFGLLYGKTYKNYINDAIPFYKSYSAAAVLNDTYGSPGGIYILSEPYMNFGVIGVVLFTLLEIYIIYWITKKKTEYSYFLYLFILTTQFRICWYGISYIEIGVIYILPILYLLMKNVNKKDASGEFVYGDMNIVNHLFRIDAIEKISNKK